MDAARRLEVASNCVDLAEPKTGDGQLVLLLAAIAHAQIAQAEALRNIEFQLEQARNGLLG